MRKITERRLVAQNWIECQETGWKTICGWYFFDDISIMYDWAIVEILSYDKCGNPQFGIAEKETNIEL